MHMLGQGCQPGGRDSVAQKLNSRLAKLALGKVDNQPKVTEPIIDLTTNSQRPKGVTMAVLEMSAGCIT